MAVGPDRLRTDIESHWESAKLGDLIPSELGDVSAAIEQAVSVINGAIDVVAGYLEVVAAGAQSFTDPLKAALEAVIGLVDEALDFLLGNSIGITYAFPRTYKSARSVNQLLWEIARSLTDHSDPDRPVANSDAHFLIWAAFASSPSVHEVASKIGGLVELFGLPLPQMPTGEISQLEALVSGRDTFVSPVAFRLGLRGGPGAPPMRRPQGLGPRWTTLRLADLGVLRQVVAGLGKASDGLRTADAIGDWFSTMITALRRRAEAIERQLKAVTDAIGRYVEIAPTTAGLSTLVLRGRGTPEEQSFAVWDAVRADGYPFEGRELETAACFVLHFQSTSQSAVETMSALLGITEAETPPVEERSPFAAIEVGWVPDPGTVSTAKRPEDGLEG